MSSPLPAPKEIDPAKRRARIASVLERGFINYKLDLSWLKERGLAGQFVRNDPNAIAGLEALDFEVYKGENVPNIHNAADGTIRVGDTILMVTSPENMDDIRYVQDQLIKARHNSDKQIEEKSFVDGVEPGLTPIIESRVEEANADHISAAINEENK